MRRVTQGMERASQVEEDDPTEIDGQGPMASAFPWLGLSIGRSEVLELQMRRIVHDE